MSGTKGIGFACEDTAVHGSGSDTPLFVRTEYQIIDCRACYALLHNASCSIFLAKGPVCQFVTGRWPRVGAKSGLSGMVGRAGLGTSCWLRPKVWQLLSAPNDDACGIGQPSGIRARSWVMRFRRLVWRPVRTWWMCLASQCVGVSVGWRSWRDRPGLGCRGTGGMVIFSPADRFEQTPSR